MFDFLVPNMTDDDALDGGDSMISKFLYDVIYRPPLKQRVLKRLNLIINLVFLNLFHSYL